MPGWRGQREASAWQPLTQQQFRELERGTPLRDYRGRRWSVHAPAPLPGAATLAVRLDVADWREGPPQVT